MNKGVAVFHSGVNIHFHLKLLFKKTSINPQRRFIMHFFMAEKESDFKSQDKQRCRLTFPLQKIQHAF